MKFVLFATTLLFYTQVTETKVCFSYVPTPKKQDFDSSKSACKDLKGELASEDLLDSENAENAVFSIYKHRVENDGDGYFWMDISSKNIGEDPSEKNPFVFSDGTEVKDTNMLIKWDSSSSQPEYTSAYKCIILHTKGLQTDECSYDDILGLCKVDVECEKECSMSNGSGRSRKNLPVFALFMAGSVFKAFYALVRPDM